MGLFGKRTKRIILNIFVSSLVISGILLLINLHVVNNGKKYIRNGKDVPKADAIIILGAYVFPDGVVSEMLADRLKVGLELFNAGKAPKIIVSGDHGKTSYDEVNTMRKYLEDRGVKRKDIFMDHAGFNTYDSMYRVRDIFLVKKAIVVTQDFHLTRALYIADKLGLEAFGVSSDIHIYPGVIYNYTREIGSRIKAFLQVSVFHSKPKYLGNEIPISGNGNLTDDGK